MCGRFALSAVTSDVEKLQKDLVSKTEIKPRYNIAPTQDIAVILNDAPNEVHSVHWGLIPFWAKDKSIGNKMINARAESVDQKASFKHPFNKKRCLILTTGFYEWKKTADKQGKIPYYIYLKDERIFTFAGLWSYWEKGEEPITSATIITTEANDLVKPIHDRMPVIIGKNDWEKWLSPETKAGELKSLLSPFSSEDMNAYEVSKKVNNPENDFPEIIEKAG